MSTAITLPFSSLRRGERVIRIAGIPRHTKMAPRPGRLAFVDLAYGSLGASLYTQLGPQAGRSISRLCNLEILNAGKMLDDVLSRVV